MSIYEMTEVKLSDTAERYIAFARFCYDFRVSPRELAELIQLADRLRKSKVNSDARQGLAIEVIFRLRQAKFTEVKIFNDQMEVDITMRRSTRPDLLIRLPIDKF